MPKKITKLRSNGHSNSHHGVERLLATVPVLQSSLSLRCPPQHRVLTLRPARPPQPPPAGPVTPASCCGSPGCAATRPAVSQRYPAVSAAATAGPGSRVWPSGCGSPCCRRPQRGTAAACRVDDCAARVSASAPCPAGRSDDASPPPPAAGEGGGNEGECRDETGHNSTVHQ